MELPSKIVLFLLLSAKVVMNLNFDHLRPAVMNKFTFEKIICKRQPGSTIAKGYKCLVKYIDRNHVKFDIHGNLTAPVSSVKLRFANYYKYNTYQPIAGAFEVNVCQVLLMKDITTTIPAMKWVYDLASKFTNIVHTCPFSGYVYGKADNVSLDEFSFPYKMPAGRYRSDITLFEDGNRISLNSSFYFSVSDHRVDVSYSKL